MATVGFKGLKSSVDNF